MLGRFHSNTHQEPLDTPNFDRERFQPLILHDTYPDVDTQMEVAYNYLHPVIYCEHSSDYAEISVTATPTLTQFTSAAISNLKRELWDLMDICLHHQTQFKTLGIPNEAFAVKVPSRSASSVIQTFDEFAQDPDNFAWHPSATAGVNPYPEHVPCELPHPHAADETLATVDDDEEHTNRVYTTFDLPAEQPQTVKSATLLGNRTGQEIQEDVESAIICPGCNTFGTPISDSNDKEWRCTTDTDECRIETYQRGKFPSRN